jgi:outer membrane protein OmpA-like peptidoglycan-associated protein
MSTGWTRRSRFPQVDGGVMYDDYYEDEDGDSPWRKRLKMVGLVTVVLMGWFVVRPQLQDRLSDGSAQSERAAAAAEPTSTTSVEATTTTRPGTSTTSSTAVASGPTTTRPAASTTLAGAAPYATTPDGLPVPVVATFYPDRITLTGEAPNAEAVSAFTALATAHGQAGGLAVQSQLKVNPSVPIGVGLRMLDLRSPAFPPAVADITPELAAYLDTVGEVLIGRPEVSVVIVGHADQRGTAEENLVLSLRRAQAVLEYLLGRGIEGTRLSARAVGEADLLSIADDEAALALNRRTEFIVHGVLVSDPATAS